MEEQKIGKITHYYSHIGVGIIQIETGSLKVGDALHFKGHSTDFQQTVDSLQIEHRSVQEAKVGDLVGMKVNEHVREGDDVLQVVA